MARASRSHMTLRDWLNAADAALYRAKHEGRNQVASVFSALDGGELQRLY